MTHFNTKHGMFGTKTYNAWGAMIQRCTNPNADSWPRYGGRGIEVCDRWLESFEDFLADMGVAPKGLTLERNDVDGPYDAVNCVWATPKAQANNRSTSAWVEYNGKTQTIQQWAEECEVEPTLLRWRIRVGKWPLERALRKGDARRLDSDISRYADAMVKSIVGENA